MNITLTFPIDPPSVVCEENKKCVGTEVEIVNMIFRGFNIFEEVKASYEDAVDSNSSNVVACTYCDDFSDRFVFLSINYKSVYAMRYRQSLPQDTGSFIFSQVFTVLFLLAIHTLNSFLSSQRVVRENFSLPRCIFALASSIILKTILKVVTLKSCVTSVSLPANTLKEVLKLCTYGSYILLIGWNAVGRSESYNDYARVVLNDTGAVLNHRVSGTPESALRELWKSTEAIAELYAYQTSGATGISISRPIRDVGTVSDESWFLCCYAVEDRVLRRKIQLRALEASQHGLQDIMVQRIHNQFERYSAPEKATVQWVGYLSSLCSALYIFAATLLCFASLRARPRQLS